MLFGHLEGKQGSHLEGKQGSHLEGKQGSHLGGSISRKGRFKPLLAGK